jgi:hypothetical protein
LRDVLRSFDVKAQNFARKNCICKNIVSIFKRDNFTVSCLILTLTTGNFENQNAYGQVKKHVEVTQKYHR